MTLAATPANIASEARPAKRGAGLFSATSRLWALGLLLVAAFAFGGGSRGDITSLIVLRPLSFLLLPYALVVISWRDWVRLGIPGMVLAGLALLAGLQLVPLPPAIWTALPGRELAAEIAATMGWDEAWRPLSLAPSRTMNTLFALGVPLAALALLASLRGGQARMLVWLILAMGAVSALLGLAQLMGAPDGPLYLYRITNEGLAVGLFSNRNHHAIFLASLVPLFGYVGLRAWAGREGRGGQARAGASLQMVAALGGLAFLLPMTLVTGSRAGAALALGMGALLAALIWRLMDLQPADGRKGRSMRKLAAPLILAGIAGLAAITHFASRSLAFDRLLDANMDAGLRADLLPHLWAMAREYFPAGTGFGAFRQAWEVIEPTALLRPQYLNQAHNDLMQFVIEGGAPALLLLLVGLFWFARSGLLAWRAFNREAARAQVPGLALFTWLALAALLSGSLFDYPLRTPSLMAVAALLAGLTQLSLSSLSTPSGRTSQ